MRTAERLGPAHLSFILKPSTFTMYVTWCCVAKFYSLPISIVPPEFYLFWLENNHEQNVLCTMFTPIVLVLLQTKTQECY